MIVVELLVGISGVFVASASAGAGDGGLERLGEEEFRLELEDFGLAEFDGLSLAVDVLFDGDFGVGLEKIVVEVEISDSHF